MNTERYDVCVIGGGAAGMAAAVSYAECMTADDEYHTHKIIILEKKAALGKKVAASGNGRCNITNTNAPCALEVTDFLKNLGIVLRTEDEGRIYPYSGRAVQIVRAFENKISRLRIETVTEAVVSSIEKTRDSFIIKMESGKSILSRSVIIASGGKSSPQFGTTGDGYAWARTLGHTVTRLAPALTSLELDKKDINGTAMKGIRAKARVSLLKSCKDSSNEDCIVASELGEVQFTDTGISGIAVFNLSRFVKIDDGESIKDLPGKYDAVIDFMPEYTSEELIKLLREREKMYGSISKMKGEWLLTIVDEKLADVLVNRIEKIADSKACDMCEAAADALKRFKCSVAGVGGWKASQVTSGGVKYDEVDSNTMESHIVENLYFAGEILDYDGPCGGFNLNHAWLTGIKAGRAAANADKQRKDLR